MIPGSNILNMALSAIARQSFQYYACTGRNTNEVGQDITQYALPVTLRGSVQPVPRNMFQTFGLDFQRNYINVYVSRDVIDIARDVSGDQVVFEGVTYQCISKTPWHGVDGWDSVLCVQVQ